MADEPPSVKTKTPESWSGRIAGQSRVIGSNEKRLRLPVVWSVYGGLV